jgi:hypothetical protein
VAPPARTARRAGNLVMTSAPFDDPEQGPIVMHFAVPITAEGSASATTGIRSACAAAARTHSRSIRYSCPTPRSR